MSTKITIVKNGPLIIESIDTLTVDGELKGKKQAFCRCGKSKDKVYCDGSHKKDKKD